MITSIHATITARHSILSFSLLRDFTFTVIIVVIIIIIRTLVIIIIILMIIVVINIRIINIIICRALHPELQLLQVGDLAQRLRELLSIRFMYVYIYMYTYTHTYV